MTIKTFTFNPFMENTYIVSDDNKEALIIDAGCMYQNEKQELQQYIEQNQLQIKCLLNTHLHLDHQFGNAFVNQLYGIKPLAHMGDADMIKNMTQQASVFGLSLDEEPQELGNFLSDGQKIAVGKITLEVIHTPGHSKGGVCFYMADKAILFSGDTLFQGSIGRTDLPGGNNVELLNSIQKRLFCLPNDTIIYPGHGDTTTIGDEKQYNPYL